jgi:hypothetical protein
MQSAASESSRTIGILSPDYLNSKFVKPEWAAAFAEHSEGRSRSLVLARVRPCEPSGMLKPLVCIDLVGLDEEQARERLLNGVSGKRAKPSKRPQFSGGRQAAKNAAPFREVGLRRPIPRHVPRIRRVPTDLEKRRFVQAAFDTVVRHLQTGWPIWRRRTIRSSRMSKNHRHQMRGRNLRERQKPLAMQILDRRRLGAKESNIPGTASIGTPTIASTNFYRLGTTSWRCSR